MENSYDMFAYSLDGDEDSDIEGDLYDDKNDYDGVSDDEDDGILKGDEDSDEAEPGM